MGFGSGRPEIGLVLEACRDLCGSFAVLPRIFGVETARSALRTRRSRDLQPTRIITVRVAAEFCASAFIPNSVGFLPIAQTKKRKSAWGPSFEVNV